VNFAQSKIPSGQEPPKCIYTAPAQETAKYRAKFGWPMVNDVAAVMKARRKTLKFPVVPQTGKPVSVVSRPKIAILWAHVEEILLFNKFFF